MNNIIWCVKTQIEVDFSNDWLKEVLQFKFEHFDKERNFDKFINGSYIAWANQEKNDDFINYINKYNELGYDYTIVHLSDEAYEQDISFYDVSKKIIRNYYNSDYSSKYNILTIPLGYKKDLKFVESKKDIVFNFVGQPKSDRLEMVEKFKNINPNFIRLTNSWNDTNTGLSTSDYSSVLSRSIFTLCPMGWVNMDSFRICESLECKSIPVTVKSKGVDYFQNIFPNHPFIIGDNWEDASKKVIELLNTNNIESKIEEVSNYWVNNKEGLKKIISKFNESTRNK